MTGREPEERITSYDLDATRRSLASLAGLSDSPPAKLFRSIAPNDLSRFEADGSESPLQRQGDSPGLSPGEVAPGEEAIPLETEEGRLWGHWVVPEARAEMARSSLPSLRASLRHLIHLEEDEKCREVNQSLWAIFGLGHALSQADGPLAMIRAVHKVTEEVLSARLTALVLVGREDGRLYMYDGSGEPQTLPTPPEAWQAAFPSGRTAWRLEDQQALSAAAFLGKEPSSGMLEPIGDSEKPIAYLAVLRREGTYAEREQGLFARIGDFVLANLMRLEELEGVRRKSRQTTDILVQLAQERERLDFVMRSVPVGILLADAQGVIDLANDAAGKALGLTDVEITESKVFAGRPAGRALLGLIQKAKAEGKPVTTPYEMEGRWFQVQVVPWPGGAQFLVVTQDIQDWHQLSRLKEDLISIISHEVKNPLAAIINAADLMVTKRPGPLTDGQVRMTELIRDNGNKIRDLLDDVVRLSRVHHMSGQQTPVPLKPLFQKLREGAHDTVQGKLLNWKEDLADLTVAGEPRMLENLFTNLIGNAVKYTGIGGSVGIRAWRENGWARCRVLDDGPGIPPKEAEKLFSAFFRASNVKEQVSGTGLGLVIAKNIVDRMGGRLEMTSPITEEDSAFLDRPKSSRPGTAFQVDLPLQE